MRRTAAILLALLCLWGLAGCRDPAKDPPGDEAEPQAAEDTLGVTMTTKNERSTGLTLVLTRSGDGPEGQLLTGSDYWIEAETGGGWQEADLLLDGEIAWDAAAYQISGNGTELELDWSFLYGALDAGTYRLRKPVTCFYDAGGEDTVTLSAVFSIVD